MSKLDSFPEHICRPASSSPPALPVSQTRRIRYLAGTWGIGIGMYVAGRDQESTTDHVQLYCAAVAVVMQHRSLGDLPMPLSGSMRLTT